MEDMSYERLRAEAGSCVMDKSKTRLRCPAASWR